MPVVSSDLRLTGERVVLRPPTPEDLEGFQRVFADPEVMRYVADGRPLSPVEAAAWVSRMIARFDADGFGQFALARRTDGALIGRAGLLPLDPETWQGGLLA